MDFDSDNDGCPDAVEGGALFTVPGGQVNGTTSQLTGAISSATATLGVPTIAGTGQTIGLSQNSAVSGCNDTDGDGIPNNDDLDDDNDGILDVAESCPVDACGVTNNLVTNGNFDQNVVGFTYGPSYVPSIVLNWPTGPTAGHCTATNNNSLYVDLRTGSDYFWRQTIAVTPNTAYKFSFASSLETTFSGSYTVEVYDGTSVIYTGTVSSTALSGSTFTTFNFNFTSSSSSSLRISLIGNIPALLNNDILIDDIALTSVAPCIKDTDGDGLADSVDFDSDNDGCPDAIEGGANFTVFGGQVNATTGQLTGTISSATATLGVPTLAGAGQNTGISLNSAVNGCADTDGDGVADLDDLDDDNDGILDLAECGGFGFVTNPSGTTVTPTIKVCYNTNAYGLNGTYMGFNDDKLTNPANFGPSGIYKVNFQLIPVTPANITEANLNALGCQIFQAGMDNTDANSGISFASLTNAQKLELKAWSSSSIDHMVLGFQGLAATWNSYVGATGVTGQMLNTELGEPLYVGPFGSATGFNQGGTYQGKYSSLPSGAYCSLIEDQAGNVIAFVDRATQDIFFADVDILSTLGGTTANNTITSNNDKIFANLYALMAQTIIKQKSLLCDYLQECTVDTDNDGILNSLDLDSDGDGCADAIEGGAAFTVANLVSTTMAGGSTNVQTNLGTTVGTTATTLGVPTIAGTGQTIGTSQSATVQDVNCPPPCSATVAPAVSVNVKTNICPATTVDLSGITVSNKPASSTLTWHTGTPATAANRITAITSLTAGTYYAAYFDAAANCYSGTATTPVTASVVACNQPPVLMPDANTFIPGTPTSGNVATNDRDPEGGPLTVTVVGTPPAGFTLNPDGSYTYTAPASQTAPVTVVYQACDNATPPACATSVLTLTPAPNPTPGNDAPVALNDATRTTAGTPVKVAVLANDNDPEGLPLSNPTLVSQPTVGTATVNPDGTINYTPPANFTGVVTFPYQVCDQGSPVVCTTALVTVTVDPTPPASVTNLPPVAVDDSKLTVKDTPVTGTVATNDSDPNAGQTLTYASLSSPANGTVVFNADGSYTYTPATGFVGTDNFVYQVCDSGSPVLCTTATAYMTVNEPITPTLFDCASITISGTFVAGTPSTGIMTIPLTQVQPGSFTMTVAGPNMTSVPSPISEVLVSGQTSLTVLVDYDGGGTGGIRSLTIASGQAGNQCIVGAPVTPLIPCTPLTPGQVVPGVASVATGGATSFSYVGASAGSTVRWFVAPSTTASPNSGTGSTTPNITFLNAGTYQIIFEETNSGLPAGCNVPNNVQSAMDYLVKAPVVPCASPSASTVLITPSTAAIAVGGIGSFTLAGGLPYSSVQWQIVPSTNASPNVGSGATTPAITFSQEGLYRIVYTLTNAGDLTCTPVQIQSAGLISVGLDPCTPPEPIGVTNVLGLPTAQVGTTVTFNATGGTIGEMTWQVYPTTGVSSVSGTGSTATLTFTQPGKYVVTFVSSNSVVPVSCTKPVAIAGSTVIDVIDTTPLVAPDINNMAINTPVSGNVLTNDKDPQGNPLTASVTTQPTVGTVTMAPDGSYTYTPPTGFTGVATFCYTAISTLGASASTCVTINVNPIPTLGNDAPIANADATQTTAGMSVTIAVGANDTDPDSATSLNGQLDKPTIVSQPSVGTAVVNPDGTVSYTPPAGFTGVVTFPYSVCDQATTPLCTTALVSVDVQPTPPVGTTLAPVAVDDALLTQMDVPKTGTVATNDTDPQGLTLTYASGQPTSGTVVMNPDGSYTYTPAPGYVGPDSFTYSVCNTASKCDVATVSVLVQLVLVPPTVAITGPVDLTTTDTNPPVSGTATALASVTVSTPDGQTCITTADASGNWTCTSLTFTPGSQTVTAIASNTAGVSSPVTANFTVVAPLVPPTVDITGPVNVTTTNTNPPISGTATALASVTVSTPDGQTCITTAAADGSWTCTSLTFTVGSQTVTAIASNTAGVSTTATTNFTVVAPLIPPTVGITGPVNVTTTNTNPPISGTATALASVTVSTPDGQTCITTAAADGSWTCTSLTFTVGSQTVTAVASNTAGVSTTATTNFTVVAPPVPPTVGITGPINVTTTNTNPPISGTATALASVTVSTPDGQTCITAADASGNWTCTSLTFTPGSQTVTAIASNTAGVSTTATTNFTVVAPLVPPTVGITGPVNVTTTNTNPPVSGTATALASVTVSTPDGQTCITTAAADGSWTCTSLTFTVGSQTVTAVASNTAGVSTTATSNFTVVAPLAPPVATPDINNTNINTPVTGNVLTNDTDPQSGTLTASVTTQPTAGTVTMSPDGTYTYTPPTDFTGTASFCYAVTSSTGLSASACVSVNVNPAPTAGNDAPIANTDATQTTAGMSVTIAVVANDTDPDSATSLNGQLDKPTIVSQPSVGTAVVNLDGTVSYTPPAGFTGVVTFPYSVCDQATTPLCATALVSVDVQPTPPVGTTLAPVAVDDALLTQVDVPKTGTVAGNDSDPQGLPLTFTTGQPTSGTVVMSPNGSYTYTPASGYVGPASFIYLACNSAGKCDPATVSVLIQPNTDLPPVVTPDVNTFIPSLPTAGNVLTNDKDPEGTPLTASVVGTPPTGFTMSPDGSYTYTAPASQTAPVTVVYQACDGNTPPSCLTTTLTLTPVPTPTPANDAPIALNDAGRTTAGVSTTLNVLGNDKDPEGLPLSNPTILSQPTQGTATVNPDGTITYTPPAGFTGVVTFPYQVCDTGSPVQCATAVVTMTVDPTPPASVTNLPPVAIDDNLLTTKGLSASGTVASNDSDPNPGQTLTYTRLSSPINGTVVFNTDGSYTYTPAPGFVGTDNFIYQVCDSGSPVLCTTATAYQTVSDVPVLAPIATPDINNTSLNTPVTGNVLTNDKDPQGNPLTVSVTTPPTAGTVTMALDGSYIYTPPTGFTGVATFCYTATSTAGLSASTCVTINVSPAPTAGNDAPIANTDATQTTAGMSVTIAVGTNDTDPDSATSLNGQLDKPTLVSQPSVGTAVVNVDGTVTYTPPAGFTGVVTFPYQICDKATTPLCTTALVSVDVQPTPPVGTTLAPVAVDDALLTQVNVPKTGTVAGNDSDPQGLPLTFTTGQPTSGTVVMSPTGSYTYTPAPGYSGPANFTYAVCNSAGKCDVATVSVLIQPNTVLPPVATSDINNTAINTPVSGNVLTNDNDPQGLPLTVSLLSQPTSGTVVLNPDGTYTYTPPTGFTGTASFCYSVTNSAGLSSSACVTVNVNPAPSAGNDTPIPNDDATQTTVGVSVTINIQANDTDPNSASTLNGQLNTPTLVSQPSVGTAVVNNVDGTVTYTPPAGFTGVVTFPYQVCDKATTPLCATALVTVTILPTPPVGTTLAPVAVDDALLTQVNVPKTVTVAGNDSDPANLTLTYASGQPTSGTVVMSPDGSYTYTPAPGYVGPASFTYSVCNTAGKCDVATVSILIQQPAEPGAVVLRLKVMLQGALIGGTGGLMRDDLRSQKFLPLTEPYSAIGGARFTHVNGGGGETMPASVTALNVGTGDAVVDWVFVELRSPSNLSLVVATRSAIVQRDGDVVLASDGVSPLSFTGLTGTSFYVSVKHRNHLGAMTATSIPLSSTGTIVDFTASTSAQLWNTVIGVFNYEGWEQITQSGKQALWAGDANHNGKVKYQGSANDLITIFSEVIGAQAGNANPLYNYNNALGYYFGDVNMDGKVKYQGTSNDTSLIFTNVITNFQTTTQMNSAQLYNFDWMLEQIP